MSLARLLRDQRHSAEAIAVIKPVYNRFTEGFSTTDLANAKALIDDLHRVSRGKRATDLGDVHLAQEINARLRMIYCRWGLCAF